VKARRRREVRLPGKEDDKRCCHLSRHVSQGAEPRKVPTNPRWCPNAKGSPREGQAPRSSNSVESCGPSPRTSGAPLPAPLGRSPTSPLSSFRPKTSRASFPQVHGGGRDTNEVVTVPQDFRPTRYNYNGSRKSRGVVWFF
jgi:hypothetical protein